MRTLLFASIALLAGALSAGISNPTGDSLVGTGQFTVSSITITGPNGILFYDGSNLTTASQGGGGDNLGNHTATTNLNMGANSIVFGQGAPMKQYPTFAVMTSTQVIYGNTLANLTGLTATLAAGGTYYCETFVVFQTTATADGFRLDFAASAGLVEVCYSREIMIVTGNSTDSFSSRYMDKFNGDTASASVSGANADHLARADGMIVVGPAAYTLQVRACGELQTTKATVK